MRRIRLALLFAVLAIASIPAALAVAAGNAAPTATSSAASSVSSNGATLNGTVNPNGLDTQYAFQYGTSPSYGEETSLKPAGAGSTAETVSAAVGGLQAGTTYHFRVIAMNADGTSVSDDLTFTTTGTATAGVPPTATTGGSSGATNSTVTIAGTVNPNGTSTSYHFEYGPTANYGFETADASAGSGTSPVSETASLKDLAPGTTYHYAIVGVSATGVTVGQDATFTTTRAPSVGTAGASQPTSDAVTLNGTINPNGLDTSYYFQYGTTTAYGLQTAPAGAGNGTSPVAVHTTATGLMPSTTYHYRLVGVNSDGTIYGNDQTASTTGVAVRASTVKLMGHMGFVSPGNVIGVEVGCFSGATPCAGAFKFTVNGNTIGSGAFKMNPETGGFHNFKLNARGVSLLKGNRVNHLLVTTVSITTTSGQKVSGRLSLARWYWHR
ncbi:MAG TPA: fibronectin type III domain-containing protein [Solirubrobacteraceae bacterium]|nr:fibronectin type III domain-containing protein [Solirubrobacteraceae bacterium]